MAVGTLAPSAIFTGFAANGTVLAGGKLYTYSAGTSSPLATYSDVNLTIANANPIILDSAGRAVIFLSAVSYKFILKDSSDVTQWSQDNISAVPASVVATDISGTAGEDLAAGDVVYLSSGAADGGRTAGLWYLADADFVLRSTEAFGIGMMPADLAMSATGSIRVLGTVTGLAGLSPGVLYYISATPGGLTSSAPTNARPIGVSDTATSLILAQQFLTQPASASTAGIVSLGAQQLGTGLKTVESLAVLGVSSHVGLASFTLPPSFLSGVAVTDPAVAIGRMFTDAAVHTTSSAGVEADLTSVTLPANALDADGKAVRIWISGKYATTGANKRLRVYFGGTVIFEFTVSGNVVGAPWNLWGTITRQGAALQVSIVRHQTGGQATNTAAAAAATNSVTVGFDNLTKDLTTALVIKTTGLDTTSAGGTVQNSFIMDVVN